MLARSLELIGIHLQLEYVGSTLVWSLLGKPRIPEVSLGSYCSELILSRYVSKSLIEFSRFRAKVRMMGMCDLCSSVHVCGVEVLDGRQEIKEAELYVERESKLYFEESPAQ